MLQQPEKTAAPDDSGWLGPGAPLRGRTVSWSALLWALVYPARRQRNAPTITGMVLIMLLGGIGTAAYNSANNILFITLSLLSASLILSGVLSWLNFRGLSWRLVAEPPLRVGQAHALRLEIRNRKRVIPSYGLWFDLKSPEKNEVERLVLPGRIDPEGEAGLEWIVTPKRRGRGRFELSYVGSLFPFGFLKKSIATFAVAEVVIWPAPVEYRRFATVSSRRIQPGEPVGRIGPGSDLFAIRKYQSGDSHRRIHWKASARLRHLMVREFAAEQQEGLSLWLDTAADRWTRPEQFELLCSFAATFAEDLFTSGKLASAAINDEPLSPVRRVRDLESFLDRIALASPVEDQRRAHDEEDLAQTSRRPGFQRRHLLTFAPDGTRGVAAYINGEKAASA